MALNLSEGSGSRGGTRRERYQNALGSARETGACLDVAVALGYVVEIGGIRIFHAGDGLLYRELPAAVSALAPDVLLLPINGRDHMRESAGIVGNMNETEAAWLCAQVDPAYVIPMHYDAIEGNTGDPGHFITMVHQSGGAAAVVLPARARPVTLALPQPEP